MSGMEGKDGKGSTSLGSRKGLLLRDEQDGTGIWEEKSGRDKPEGALWTKAGA